MIGAFARMLGRRDRVVACHETDSGYTTQTTSPEGAARRDDAHDAPPEAFVEKVSEEGGDVYVAPVLEALRAALRRRLSGARDEPATTVPEASTSPPPR